MNRQIDTPTWILPHPGNPDDYKTALASEHATPYPTSIVECRAGAKVKVFAGNFFEDDRGKFWLAGNSQIYAVDEADEGLVAVERVETGVRVLRWSQRLSIRRASPNRYVTRASKPDLWVVEFPDGPEAAP